MDRIKQGMFVKLYNSKEVFKVLSVDSKQALLIDAENKHRGTYPFDELQIVKKVKLIQIYVEDK
jgi:hypothetical protein